MRTLDPNFRFVLDFGLSQVWQLFAKCGQSDSAQGGLGKLAIESAAVELPGSREGPAVDLPPGRYVRLAFAVRPFRRRAAPHISRYTTSPPPRGPGSTSSSSRRSPSGASVGSSSFHQVTSQRP
jgi:hypothetical protein